LNQLTDGRTGWQLVRLNVELIFINLCYITFEMTVILTIEILSLLLTPSE
jgi:hypothetical protein